MKHFVTILAFCALTCSPAFSQSEGILHTFTDGSDGAIPVSGLIDDADGNFYGTALNSSTGYGVVFQLAPPVDGGTWTENVLYSFTNGFDGSDPQSNVVMDSGGNLYGTTIKGGANGCGTFYQLVPGSPWTENTLFAFPCGPKFEGAYYSVPGNIVLNSATGALYGIVESGGPLDGGWVYELAPAGDSWNYSVLHSFNSNPKSSGYANGCTPKTIILAPDTGDLFGAAPYCGQTAENFSGAGTVFRLSPNPNNSPNWNFTLIHSFPAPNYLGDAPDGETPYGLAIGKGGVLYGGAAAGGSSELGLIYSLAQAGPSEPWTFSILYSFTGGQNGDGSYPLSGVVVGNGGVLYGATAGGGTTGTDSCNGYAGCGTIFELSETNGLWTETVLHSFADNGVDGENPNWGALLLRAGDLYGMTTQGGADNDGVAYAFHP
jgi:uncharacterized repeat protein (TIGR03803 family)